MTRHPDLRRIGVSDEVQVEVGFPVYLDPAHEEEVEFSPLGEVVEVLPPDERVVIVAVQDYEFAVRGVGRFG